ncbi:hypothetical protein LTS08_000069 [Lithohypha guttulata]|nr:hypothetical protein LTS08_000069 [Lithohypha guttulata]
MGYGSTGSKAVGSSPVQSRVALDRERLERSTFPPRYIAKFGTDHGLQQIESSNRAVIGHIPTLFPAGRKAVQHKLYKSEEPTSQSSKLEQRNARRTQGSDEFQYRVNDPRYAIRHDDSRGPPSSAYGFVQRQPVPDDASFSELFPADRDAELSFFEWDSETGNDISALNKVKKTLRLGNNKRQPKSDKVAPNLMKDDNATPETPASSNKVVTSSTITAPRAQLPLKTTFDAQPSASLANRPGVGNPRKSHEQHTFYPASNLITTPTTLRPHPDCMPPPRHRPTTQTRTNTFPIPKKSTTYAHRVRHSCDEPSSIHRTYNAIAQLSTRQQTSSDEGSTRPNSRRMPYLEADELEAFPANEERKYDHLPPSPTPATTTTSNTSERTKSIRTFMHDMKHDIIRRASGRDLRKEGERQPSKK